jgi:hypothetical protein
MITLIAAACMVRASSAQGDNITAAEVVSKMLAHYAGLKTLTGSITLTITAEAPTGKVSREYDTQVAYERPSKVYLSQVDRATKKTWLVTSDGTIFTHDTPGNALPSRGHRMIEPVTIIEDQRKEGSGKSNVVSDTSDVTKIYAVCCTSIHDRSVPLGIAFSWNDEMRRFISQWVNPGFVAQASGGKDPFVIGGDYRSFATDPPSPVTGTFRMVISRNYDLVEYSTSEFEGVPQHPGITVAVISDWKVNLTPNGQPNEDLFRAVKS